MKEIFVFQIPGKRSVGVAPRAEVMQLPTDLFGPAPCCMGKERKVVVWLGGFGRLAEAGVVSKINVGDGDCSFTNGHFVYGRLLLQPAT